MYQLRCWMILLSNKQQQYCKFIKVRTGVKVLCHLYLTFSVLWRCTEFLTGKRGCTCHSNPPEGPSKFIYDKITSPCSCDTAALSNSPIIGETSKSAVMCWGHSLLVKSFFTAWLIVLVIWLPFSSANNDCTEFQLLLWQLITLFAFWDRTPKSCCHSERIVMSISLVQIQYRQILLHSWKNENFISAD